VPQRGGDLGEGAALSGQDLDVVLRYEPRLAVERALEPSRLLRIFHVRYDLIRFERQLSVVLAQTRIQRSHSHISRRFVSLGVRHVDVGSLALLGSGDVSVAVSRRRRDRLVRTAGTVRY
jgi:hypothetical protein